MGIATAVVWGMFAFIINGVDPESASWLGFLLFYLSLFLAVAGSTAILGFLIRFKILRHELAFHSVKIAFRQSFLFSFLIIAILYLLAEDLFTWTNLLLLIIIISVFEFFLISYKKN